MSTLNVHFLPSLVAAEDLAGATVVVIDVLRATTTITCALAAGAREVVPCLEVDEARRIAASYAAGTVVLGGERGGRRIEGFDLGNSPWEHTPESVGGRTVVFTTTNGTRAIEHCRLAGKVLLGAFVNLSAIIRAVADAENVHLLCAGTRGQITREDVLLAGAIVARLTHPERADLLVAANQTGPQTVNDQARIATNCWRRIMSDQTHVDRAALVHELRESLGGRDLIELGLDADILAAAEIDRIAIVPRWAPDSGTICAG